MKLSNCKNMEELVNEVYEQLQETNSNLENYTLLNQLEDYLEKFLNASKQNDCFEDVEEWEDLHEQDIKEEIFNFFEYDYNGTLTEEL